MRPARYFSIIQLSNARLGVKFDKEKNAGLRGRQEEISKPDSKVRVFVIPTNEELAIARETLALVK